MFMGGSAEDLDPAVLDRVDEQLQVALPTEPLRAQILQLYFSKYLVEPQDATRGGGFLRSLSTLVSGRAAPNKIDVSELDQVHPCNTCLCPTLPFVFRELRNA